ncbi:MAG TPA: hypothetical protein DCR93_36655, partial [Cytophagales bacterium]|nr:hypothetical protein [Cytophagales bacterium]
SIPESAVEANQLWTSTQSGYPSPSLTLASGTSSSAFAGVVGGVRPSWLSAETIANVGQAIVKWGAELGGIVEKWVTGNTTFVDFLTKFISENKTELLKVLVELYVPGHGEESWDAMAKVIDMNELGQGLASIVNQGTPEADYFAPQADGEVPENVPFLFGDAGLSDNFGLMALLRRGVKNVIIFVNTETVLDPEFNPTYSPGETMPPVDAAQIDPTVAAFFGLTDPVSWWRWNPTEGGIDQDRLKVFNPEGFPGLVAQWQACKQQGKPLVAETSHTVLPNEFWTVEGGYDVNILWYYNDRSANWEEAAGPEVMEALKKDGELKDNVMREFFGAGTFPNYGTMYSPLGGLTPFQANMLANYAYWGVEQMQSQVEKLLKG